MRLERSTLVTLLVYAIVIGGFSLAVPVAVQVLVNTIALGSVLQPLVVLSILLLSVLLLSGGLQLVQWYATEILSRRLFVRVAEDFARRLPFLSLDAGSRYDTRELVHRFFEVTTFQKASGRLLLDGVGLFLQTLVGLLLLAFYHPVLLVFDLALVACLGAVIAFGYGGVRSAIEESNRKYDVAAWLSAVASQPTLFGRATGARFATLRADALTRDYLKERKAHYRIVFRQLVGGVGVHVGALVALLGVGGWLVLKGELTLGQLVAAELVVSTVAAGFSKLGKHIEVGYDLLAALYKIGRVIDLPLEPSESRTELPTAPVPLALVAVVGEDGDTPKGAADIVLPSRGRVELRSSLALSRAVFMEGLAGLRRLDNWSLQLVEPVKRRLSSADLRRFALLLRSHQLIPGTVLDNLMLVAPDVDEERVWQALGRAGLDGAIAGLEQGLQTWLAPDGAPLAPADVARLGVVRALLAEPPLLLVDGALDGLELADEAYDQLLDAVLGPSAPFTVVVVTRDQRVKKWLDIRLDLDRGVLS